MSALGDAVIGIESALVSTHHHCDAVGQRECRRSLRPAPSIGHTLTQPGELPATFRSRSGRHERGRLARSSDITITRIVI